ncbi:MAG: hypothetical protein IKM04_01440 [Clostridia bacterium]|nr:hypothetical protein [Clostridia bacterium]
MICKPIDDRELEIRIEFNFNRLAEGDYYSFENIFSPEDYTWYGDKEGRALLAFVSHFKISGREIPCMAQLLSEMGSRFNREGYFGPVFKEEIHEQQLSGHSWLLRGLCEHYEAYGDELCLSALRRIAENLYLTKMGQFYSYPVDRSQADDGGVMGADTVVIGRWNLSSDVGCAFMSIDGLSHAYRLTKDERIKELVDEMIDVYLGIDKVKLRVQTHCTLTAARGMVRMYRETADERYLKGAKEIFELYVSGGGMTETYQNLNWWGRPDTWTEPCAIVDSFMLAGELYKLTSEEQYRTLAARIYHNGLATAQRDNGGAGTDTVVLDGVRDVLFAQMYEAFFCCTMRLAEGLRYLSENKELFVARLEGGVYKKGRIYSDGDLLYAEVTGGAERYAEHFVELDGRRLCPVVKYFKVPSDTLMSSKQRILF